MRGYELLTYDDDVPAAKPTRRVIHRSAIQLAEKIVNSKRVFKVQGILDNLPKAPPLPQKKEDIAPKLLKLHNIMYIKLAKKKSFSLKPRSVLVRRSPYSAPHSADPSYASV